MKSPAFFLALFLIPFTAFAQGPLAPPAGSPAPSMKSLDQLETRTPLIAGSPGVEVSPSGSISIQAPGSYYLTRNLSVTQYNGIIINASGVTVDLNGYAISSSFSGNSGKAIEIGDDQTRVSISNGHIIGGSSYGGSSFVHGAGFNYGIVGDCSLARVTNVSVSGIRYNGINLDAGTPDNSDIVQACTVRTVEGVGIQAGVVTDCSVTQGGPQTIIASRVANSVGARADGSGSGIVTTGTTLEMLGAGSDKRTPISSLPFTISTSGSYYLAKSLEFNVASGDAISITSPNVTLDLNGFTLSSTGIVAGNAIFVSNDLDNITIKNGNIAGNTTVSISGSAPNETWMVNAAGFQNGLFAGTINSGFHRNMIVANLQVSGCRGNGISANHSTVTGSTANYCGGFGITAYEGSVVDCTSKYNGTLGINSYNVSGCLSLCNGNVGISASDGCITNTSVIGNGHNGIIANGATITNSISRVNSRRGTANTYDISAGNSVIAFTKYGTGNTPGCTLTGNNTP